MSLTPEHFGRLLGIITAPIGMKEDILRQIDRTTPNLWSTLSVDELEQRLRQIANRTQTDDAFRDAVIEELGYPYSKDGIAVASVRNGQSSMVMAMLHHESGTISI